MESPIELLVWTCSIEILCWADLLLHVYLRTSITCSADGCMDGGRIWKGKVKGRDCYVDRTNRSPGGGPNVNWFFCWMLTTSRLQFVFQTSWISGKMSKVVYRNCN